MMLAVWAELVCMRRIVGVDYVYMLRRPVLESLALMS